MVLATLLESSGLVSTSLDGQDFVATQQRKPLMFTLCVAGNSHIERLTAQRLSQLRVELEDFEGQQAHAVYSYFAIGSEQEKYALKLLGKYEGGGAGKYRIAAVPHTQSFIL